ncbi:YbhB/YbcL family Raf kinase inhibitor-like protein [Irregularibacter muris]|uniref:YbhB/YbcL family Raf kinase inhibitor-like protein n=1 Tax=Irregularibacter muris TaxID=1796619 RepID=A0AAE3HHQ0_9FIRM|nr:YbhB/YbcL family Raf kinase inhibitor-like protein [Irregularibacter muris]MCR1899634.1 YbhB/YbcL family Raf kinase inhibitor-like protein [Irregularibacter muris]
MTFELYSSALVNNRFKDEYGNLSKEGNTICGIPQRSFPLNWKGIPEGTESFAIVFIDYDNSEGFPFVHWLACNIPGNVTSLEENASREADFFIQGMNSWSIPYGPYENIPEDLTLHFGGPAPSSEHEYEIVIYALDRVLNLEKGFHYNELRKAMRGHILSKATLIGLYG